MLKVGNGPKPLEVLYLPDLPDVRTRTFTLLRTQTCRRSLAQWHQSCASAQQKKPSLSGRLSYGLRKDSLSGPFVGSEPTQKDQHHKDDQDSPDHADTAVAVAIAIAAEAPAEPAEQEDDKNYD